MKKLIIGMALLSLTGCASYVEGYSVPLESQQGQSDLLARTFPEEFDQYDFLVTLNMELICDNLRSGAYYAPDGAVVIMSESYSRPAAEALVTGAMVSTCPEFL